MISRLLLCGFLLAAAAVSVAAQTPGQKCPTFEVKATEASVSAGGSVTLTVKVINPDPDTDYTYNWSVSSGAISSGQGTEKIVVDLTSETMTATVDLGGGSPSCDHSAWITITPKGKAGSEIIAATFERFRDRADRTVRFRIA